MSFRFRLVISALLASAVVVGGTLMERQLGERIRVAAAASGEVSGAWFCPHAGGDGWRVWVVAANPSAGPASVRLTTYSAGAPPQTVQSAVEPGTHRYFDVTRAQPASASVIEFFGSPVAAGMIAARPKDGGLAAEPCGSGASDRWFVPEGSSLRGEQSYAVVFNPFAADAVVDVGLVARDRVIHPGPLKGVVLGPGETKAFDLNRFVLGEESLTASVTALLGRVAAAGVVVSKGGLRSVLATAEPARSWVIPGAGDAAEGELIVLAPNGLDVPFRAVAQGPEAQAPVIDLESVTGGTAMAFDIQATDAGLFVVADGPEPFVAGRRLAAAVPVQESEESKEPGKGSGGGKKDKSGGGKSGGKNARGDRKEQPPPLRPDLASSAGAPAAMRGWVALPPVGPEGGAATLLLQNPGEVDAEASVTLLAAGGPQGDSIRVTVPAGTTARVELPGTPVTAVVRVRSGALVAAQVALGPRTFAVAVASPLP